ncbi:unnamed protein product [Prunus brigantina]
MFPTKSPGIDGIFALFNQKYWEVMGTDIEQFFNHTLITLIPKVTHPSRVTKCGPISLCSVLYKLVSKTIVNRLKEVMLFVISECQSAFVPCRTTLAASLRRGCGRFGWASLAVDGHNTYWAVLLGRGIFRAAVSQYYGQGMEWAVCCSYAQTDCHSLLTIIRAYKRAYGQKINFDKSATCFSLNTDPMMHQLISSMLGVSIVPCHEFYLGLPTVAWRSLSQMFKNVCVMLWNKLHGWSSKLLSLVAQALLTYIMGVFQLS